MTDAKPDIRGVVMRVFLSAAACVFLLLSIGACGDSSSTAVVGVPPAPSLPPVVAPAAKDGWVGVWATAPYGPYPGGPLASSAPAPYASLTSPGAFPDNQARDQSFRMIVRPTLGGKKTRVRLSNLLGTNDVVISEVRIGLRLAGSAVIRGTDTPVRFGGQAKLVMAPGIEAVSDPVDFAFTPSDDVAVSFHIEGNSGPMTWHAISFDVQYLTAQGAGNVTADSSGTAYAETSVGWFFITGIDVLREDALGSIVAIGDSITDGAYIVPSSNTRWTDLLARRLQTANIPMGVLNEGINSNRVSGTSPSAYAGDPAVLRFDRDVLERAGVRSVVIFEGTNDLGGSTTVDQVVEALDGLIDRAHKAHLCVVLGTITPRNDVALGYDRASKEPKRLAVNQWIREQGQSGRVEGIADFDAVMGTITDPAYPNPALYFPDLLHPNSAGFSLMAEAVPIEALAPPPAGKCTR